MDDKTELGVGASFPDPTLSNHSKDHDEYDDLDPTHLSGSSIDNQTNNRIKEDTHIDNTMETEIKVEGTENDFDIDYLLPDQDQEKTGKTEGDQTEIKEEQQDYEAPLVSDGFHNEEGTALNEDNQLPIYTKIVKIKRRNKVKKSASDNSRRKKGRKGQNNCTPFVSLEGMQEACAPYEETLCHPPGMEEDTDGMEPENTKKSFICLVCSATFTKQGGLKRHSFIHTGERPYLCSACGAAFRRQTHLTRHMRTHTGEKPYPCPMCSACFTRPSHVTRHIKTHTNVKTYTCPACEDTFTKKSEMVLHLSTHTDLKIHGCTECPARFRLKGQLMKHTRTHTGEKPYLCATCASSFSQRSDLTSHMRTHTGEKPFTCPTCAKSFAVQSNWKRHIRIHSDIKPHHCAFCDSSFSRREDLKTHTRMHTGEEPYTCSICGASFRRRRSLTRHLNRCVRPDV